MKMKNLQQNTGVSNVIRFLQSQVYLGQQILQAQLLKIKMYQKKVLSSTGNKLL